MCVTPRVSHFFACCHTSSSVFCHVPRSWFRVAGVNLPGPVTYFTTELANWRADPTAKNNFSYKLTDADRIKGGNAPVKKAPNAPALQAAIGNAGGELQRAGAGGENSVIGAMPTIVGVVLGGPGGDRPDCDVGARNVTEHVLH
jgi:hypothetical protein